MLSSEQASNVQDIVMEMLSNLYLESDEGEVKLMLHLAPAQPIEISRTYIQISRNQIS